MIVIMIVINYLMIAINTAGSCRQVVTGGQTISDLQMRICR